MRNVTRAVCAIVLVVFSGCVVARPQRSANEGLVGPGGADSQIRDRNECFEIADAAAPAPKGAPKHNVGLMVLAAPVGVVASAVESEAHRAATRGNPEVIAWEQKWTEAYRQCLQARGWTSTPGGT